MTSDEREELVDRTLTLARLWVVLSVLGEICPSSANRIKKNEYQRMARWVSDQAAAIHRMIEEAAEEGRDE